MKRDFLRNFKVGDNELPKEVIDAILDENGRDIDTVKKQYGDYDTVKKQLEEANKTIEDFKGMDIEGIKKAADDWKKKAEEAKKEAESQIESMKFDGIVSAAIAKAKGRSKKAIMAELGVETLEQLKKSKNQESDVQNALEKLKKDSGYLFESQSVPPYADGTGNRRMVENKPALSLEDALRERYERKDD